MNYLLLSVHPMNLPYDELRQVTPKAWVVKINDRDLFMAATQYEMLSPIKVQSFDAATQITKLAFRSRFKDEEKVKLYTLAKKNVLVQAYLDDLQAANFINLARPDTIAAVRQLEAMHVLKAGRADEILYTVPKADELA